MQYDDAFHPQQRCESTDRAIEHALPSTPVVKYVVKYCSWQGLVQHPRSSTRGWIRLGPHP